MSLSGLGVGVGFLGYQDTSSVSFVENIFFTSTEVHGHPFAVQLYEPFPRLSN